MATKGSIVKSDNVGLRPPDAAHGASRFMPADIRLVAEADLTDFAPCACVCFKPCLSQAQHERTYARLYENRLETNHPIAPCLCCTDDLCIVDIITVLPFDKTPNAPGMCCVCIPCVCCGRPTIFNKITKCLGCIDCTPCFGEVIFASPSSCFGLRSCCCVGSPCYETCAWPVTPPLNAGGETFVGLWRGALEQFQQKHDRRDKYTARFTRVQDRFCDCDKAQEVPAIIMQR